MEPASKTLQSLPPDAQRLVMQARPELTPVWYSTSRRNQELLSSHFAVMCRDKPISFGEFTKFLDQALATPGRTFGIVDVDSGVDKFNLSFHYLISIMEYGVLSPKELRFRYLPIVRLIALVPDKVTTVEGELADEIRAAAIKLGIPAADVLEAYAEYQYTSDIELKAAPGEIEKIKLEISQQKSAGSMFSNFKWYELDFQSQYFIYQNRIGCMKANPKYARQKIIDALNFLIAQSDNGSFPEVLTISARLIAEARIAAIPYYNIQNMTKLITATGLEAGRLDKALYHEIQSINRENAKILIQHYDSVDIKPRILSSDTIRIMDSGILDKGLRI